LTYEAAGATPSPLGAGAAVAAPDEAPAATPDTTSAAEGTRAMARQRLL
jgi:hypothetical protein